MLTTVLQKICVCVFTINDSQPLAENITILTTMTHYMVGNLTTFYEAVVATKVGGKSWGA